MLNQANDPMNQITQDIDILPMSPIQIANNQTVPINYQIMAMESVLKSNPQYILCPYCKQVTPTKAMRSLSYWNTLLCVASPMIWGIAKIFRNKDLNCYNAEHLCLSCGANLSIYKAC